MFQQAAQGAADFIEDSGLELAVSTGNDPVAAASIEANAQMPVFVFPYRILYLVAVAVYFGRGENGLDGNIQPANPSEGICHRVLFGLQLRLIAEMAEAAAAAGASNRAVHRNPVRRSGFQGIHNPKSIPLAILDNSGLDLVSGCRARHKDCFSLPVAHAAAVTGQPLNGQGDDLVFL